MPVFSLSYSIPYVLFLLYLFILFVIEQKKIRKEGISVIQNVTWISLLLFIGLRGFIYSDWISYYAAYEKLPETFTLRGFELDNDWEKGFVYYTLIIKLLGVNYWGWNFISAFIDLFILHLLFKKESRYYVLAFIAYYVYGGLGMDVNLMRNAKSIMLFLLSIPYLQNKKFFPYLLINLLGVTFHTSSLLYIPLYFLLNKRLSKKIYLWIFLIGNLLYLFKIHYITPVLYNVIGWLGGRTEASLLLYMNNSTFYGITIGYVERVLFCGVLYFYYERIQKDGDKYVYLNIFMMYFFTFFYFSEFSIISGRLSTLFIVAYWFLVPMLYSYFGLKLKKYFLLVFLIYGVFKTFYANDSLLCRYDNLIFGIESYENRRYIFNRYKDVFFEQ